MTSCTYIDVKEVQFICEMLFYELKKHGYTAYYNRFGVYMEFTDDYFQAIDSNEEQLKSSIGYLYIAEDCMMPMMDVSTGKDVPSTMTLNQLGVLFRTIGTLRSAVLGMEPSAESSLVSNNEVLTIADMKTVADLLFVEYIERGIGRLVIPFNHYWDIREDVSRYIFPDTSEVDFPIYSISDTWDELIENCTIRKDFVKMLGNYDELPGIIEYFNKTSGGLYKLFSMAGIICYFSELP